jgi:hypothetical protein
MSNAALEAPARGPRLIPAEISNWIASFWLTLGFGVVLMLLLWPELGELASFFVGGGGRTLFLLIVGGLVAVGGYVTIGVLQADASRFRLGKIFLLVALFVGALAAIGLVILRMQAPQTMDAGLQSPTFWGASPTLAALLFIEPEVEDEGPRTRPMKARDSAAAAAAAAAVAAEEPLAEDQVEVVEEEVVSFDEGQAAEAPQNVEEPLPVDSDFEINLGKAEARLAGVDQTQQTPVKPVMPDEIDAPLPAGEFELDDDTKK